MNDLPILGVKMKTEPGVNVFTPVLAARSCKDPPEARTMVDDLGRVLRLGMQSKWNGEKFVDVGECWIWDGEIQADESVEVEMK